MENKENNILKGLVVLLCFALFASFSLYHVTSKRTIRIEEQQAIEQQKLEEERQRKQKEKEESLKPTPTPEEDEIVNGKNGEININNISNYPLNELTFKLNGVDCELPVSVSSMSNFGYLFQDKVANGDGGYNYTYNQLKENLNGNSYYGDFVYTLSPANQIVSLLIKNPSDEVQMIYNCDVYGISASTCNYGISEVEPSFEMSNGLYLGMPEGEMFKIMGNPDKKFSVADNENATRYQWYQTLDGKEINNILTCDILDGYVQMLSIEY